MSKPVAGDRRWHPQLAELAADRNRLPPPPTRPEKRKAAPIFDSVEVAESPRSKSRRKLVVVVDVHLGRGGISGVNVGEYPSR
jgi:hypothetical protein